MDYIKKRIDASSKLNSKLTMNQKYSIRPPRHAKITLDIRGSPERTFRPNEETSLNKQNNVIIYLLMNLFKIYDFIFEMYNLIKFTY